MKKIILLILIILLFTGNVSAEMEGSISLEYDNLNSNNYGAFALYKNFNDKFKIGGKVQKYNDGLDEENIKLLVDINLTDKIEFNFEKGNNRYFREPNYIRKYDDDYIRFGLKYNLLKNNNSIESYLSLKYEPESQKSYGEIYLMKNLTSKFKIGGRMTTDMYDWGLKDNWFPVGHPERQTYDLIIEYDITDNITINLTEGCRHYFSQSNYNSILDDWYLKYGITYNF